MRNSEIDLYAQSISRYVNSLESNHLPYEVVAQAKKCLLDSIGATLPGSSFEWGKQFFNLISDDNNKECTLIGSSKKATTLTSAFFNGCMANILDSVDGSKYGGCHGGCVIVPAALVMAESLKASGAELILALITGYDVMIRVAASVHPSYTRKGHNPDGIPGTLGAAAAGSKLFGLSVLETLDALSAAAFIGPLSLVGDSHIGRYSNRPAVKGMAASAGCLATLMAKNGLHGSRLVFEGNLGFCHTEADDYDLEKITQDLGKRFMINEVYFKPFPGERHAHSACACALVLKKNYDIGANDIQKIVVRTYKLAVRMMGQQASINGLISEHTASLPFLVAAAFYYGKLGPEILQQEVLSSKEVHALSNLVECRVDPELEREYPDKTGAIVEVTISGGKRLLHQIEYPKGDLMNPMSDSELIVKFYNYASICLEKDHIEKIIDRIYSLEHLEDVKELTNLLSFTPI